MSEEHPEVRTLHSKVKDKATLDGQELKHLVEGGLIWLRTNQQTVNSLNVFPVPDGDTGTNMVLTLQAAINEIINSHEKNVGKIARDIAQGALMGARGNSGVILSQLWRGFARTLDNFNVMDAQLFVRALAESRDTAYKGVVRPVEGTILTVAKDLTIEAEKSLSEGNDMEEIFERVVIAAAESVERTPELLPILKQAGVVDAGGKGLFYMLEGMLRTLHNLPLEAQETFIQPIAEMANFDQHLDFEPDQDYEVVIDFQPYKPLEMEEFYDSLSDIGTSIQLGEGDDYYRLHIHVPTEKRYTPIDFIMNMGNVSKVHIENIKDQITLLENSEPPGIELTKPEPGQIAVVAVSPGNGISKIFASLGVAAIVEGGQTMNPSIKELLESFENLPTNNIIILPNNKNIILAAQGASEASIKQVAVIPSKSIPQGLNALLQLDPDGDFDEIVKKMNNALADSETGEITIATRDVEIDGVNVKQGAVIGLLNGKLVASDKTLEKTCLLLLKKINMDEKERITLFYGNQISEDEVEKIVKKISKTYPDHEVEIHSGGQPHYQFIISIE
jgi:DAK2 domain fusion protein YloV